MIRNYSAMWQFRGERPGTASVRQRTEHHHQLSPPFFRSKPGAELHGIGRTSFPILPGKSHLGGCVSLRGSLEERPSLRLPLKVALATRAYRSTHARRSPASRQDRVEIPPRNG